MRTCFLLPFIFATALAATAVAQSPAPIVVQAAPAPAAAVPPPLAQAANADSANTQATLKSLLDLKAANAETLRKQEATLLQLDELEKAADQIRIYSKRG